MYSFKTRRVLVGGRALDFYYLPHPGAVGVVPVEGGRLGLIRQYRPSIDAWIWEIPAGTLERGEDPAACAARELAEETGYRAGRIAPLGRFYVAPGYSTELLQLFKAEDLTPGERSLDEGEQIGEMQWFSFHEAMELVRRGELIDAKSIIAVQRLLLDSEK